MSFSSLRIAAALAVAGGVLLLFSGVVQTTGPERDVPRVTLVLKSAGGSKVTLPVRIQGPLARHRLLIYVQESSDILSENRLTEELARAGLAVANVSLATATGLLDGALTVSSTPAWLEPGGWLLLRSAHDLESLSDQWQLGNTTDLIQGVVSVAEVEGESAAPFSGRKNLLTTIRSLPGNLRAAAMSIASNASVFSSGNTATKSTTVTIQAPTESLARELAAKHVSEQIADEFETVRYATTLPGHDLGLEERSLVDQALLRLGGHRGEIWDAITRMSDAEQANALRLLSQMEDFDLAKLSADELRRTVRAAHSLRQRSPWSAPVPESVFVSFVADPRVGESLRSDQLGFHARLAPLMIKYSTTTAEAADALNSLMIALHDEAAHSPVKISGRLARMAAGGCEQYALAFAGLARGVGMPSRVAYNFWPTIGNGHYWNEVWDTEKQRWHGFDASALDRPYDFPWMHRVTKTAILSAGGKRGSWNALAERRFEALHNSIEEFYPSGRINVSVTNSSGPAASVRVTAEVWLGLSMGGTAANAKKFHTPEMFQVLSAVTDENGRSQMKLGETAWKAYRISVQGTDGDWKWVVVRSNQTHNLVLNADCKRPFDLNDEPPGIDDAAEDCQREVALP